VNEFGKTNSGSELAFGLLLGTGLFSITIGILWVFGCYKVTGLNSWTVAIYSFSVSIFVSVFEEILFRGILFRIIEQWIGTWIALIISAMVFGLLHLSSPGSNFGVAVMIALEAGVLLAAGYVLTRRLWFVIGLHFSWNFVQGGIFGGTVSGGNTNGILESTLTGPVLLTGGKFGAEASIVAVIVCTIASVYMLWNLKKKGNFIKPFWISKTVNAQQVNPARAGRAWKNVQDLK
jgi:membrane protease YdiL (CAAX protease family)